MLESIFPFLETMKTFSYNFATLTLIFILTLYHCLISLVLFCIPRRFRTKNIKGQKIIITGAGSGIGRQLAIEFSKHSVKLVLVDINKDGLLQTEKLIDSRSRAFIYTCDVSDRKMVYTMAKKIKEDIGDVDILVNNAGIVQGKYFMDIPDDNITKTIEVNTLAHFWTCKAFLPAMMARKKGHIVSVASIAGKIGTPKMTDYCASKFSAVGFAESLEMELNERGLHGIKTTIVYPSFISTGLFTGSQLSMAPMLTPEYVAEEIVLGVLLEHDTIILPFYLGIPFAIKDLVPRWVVRKVFMLNGEIKCMRTFQGRTEKNGQSEDKPVKAD